MPTEARAANDEVKMMLLPLHRAGSNCCTRKKGARTLLRLADVLTGTGWRPSVGEGSPSGPAGSHRVIRPRRRVRG